MLPRGLATAACPAPVRRTRPRFGPVLESLEGRALLATLSIFEPGGLAGFVQTPDGFAKGSVGFSDHPPVLNVTHLKFDPTGSDSAGGDFRISGSSLGIDVGAAIYSAHGTAEAGTGPGNPGGQILVSIDPGPGEQSGDPVQVTVTVSGTIEAVNILPGTPRYPEDATLAATVNNGPVDLGPGRSDIGSTDTIIHYAQTSTFTSAIGQSFLVSSLVKVIPRASQDALLLAGSATIYAQVKTLPRPKPPDTSSSTVPAKGTSAALKVTQGQLTFDAEGNDDADSKYFSRVPHWPGGASGVTIGRGYDMKNRTKKQVLRDLEAAGVGEDEAQKLAKGAGLKGAAAEKFVEDNTSLEISLDQQHALFEKTYPSYVKTAERVYNKTIAKVKKDPKPVQWSQLDPAIRDVLVDFTYQGKIKSPKKTAPIQAGMYNNLGDLISFIQKDSTLSKDEPGRQRVEYLMNAQKAKGNSSPAP